MLFVSLLVESLKVLYFNYQFDCNFSPQDNIYSKLFSLHVKEKGGGSFDILEPLPILRQNIFRPNEEAHITRAQVWLSRKFDFNSRALIMDMEQGLSSSSACKTSRELIIFLLAVFGDEQDGKYVKELASRFSCLSFFFNT